MSKDLKKLDCWNKSRDYDRRNLSKKILRDNNIKFTQTSPGCFKIHSDKYHGVMFYPKSATIIWFDHLLDKQKKFINEKSDKIIKQLNRLI